MLRLHSFLRHFTPNSSLIHKPTVSFSLNLHHFTTCNQKHVSLGVSVNSSVVTELSVASDSDTKKPENSELVISFLKDNGFSKTQLEKVIDRCPKLLSLRVENNLKPKIKFFQDFGFSDSEIAELLLDAPWILSNSLSNKIVPAFSVLNGLLGSDAGVKRLVMISSWFITKDLEKSLVPNVDYLLSCGVDMERIRKYLYRHWRFFLCKPESMKRLVDRADRLGADRGSPMFLEAVKVVNSMSEETYERKLQAFLELGFSEDDIQKIFAKAPTVFALSLEKVNGVKEILLATGKYTMKDVVSHPKAVTYSLEKRYKPRLSILGALEHKNLIKDWPALSVLCSLSDEIFLKKFAVPHRNEISEVLTEAAIR